MHGRGVIANNDRPAYAVSKVSDSPEQYLKLANNGRGVYMQQTCK